MDINKVKEFVKEMFPDVGDDDVDYLVRTSPNVDAIVTKILTREYKGFNISLKDLVLTPRQSSGTASPELYYPEIFNNSFIDEHVDVQDIRRRASALYEKAEYYSSKRTEYKTRQARDYYSEETERLVEEARMLNRKAALVIIKKSIGNPRLLDLHGLYVQEALMFLSDFIGKIGPREFGVVTGQEKAEGTLRPSVIALLRRRRYMVEEKGPCLYARRQIP